MNIFILQLANKQKSFAGRKRSPKKSKKAAAKNILALLRKTRYCDKNCTQNVQPIHGIYC
jgi:hypothetical protein